MSKFWFLATPFGSFPGGTEAALKAATEQSALLTKAGVPVFSPIVHNTPICAAAGMDELDTDMWVGKDGPFIEAAGGLIFCELPGYNNSKGMHDIRGQFHSAGKPIVYMAPDYVPSLPPL